MMPAVTEATQALGTAWVLSQYSPDEEYLSERKEGWFLEGRCRLVFEKFKKSLEEVEKRIQERNATRDSKYLCLLPSRVPNSIAV
mmetsp:Transcript_36089/g.50114  ORF Transcript_36089/g.50114 Transcript_36089/m.50114 type:complete len:85 (-) Transcript_36089:114-368(-)